MDSTRLAAAQHQLRLLQVEKGKLSELSDLLKRKLAQARRFSGSIRALLRLYWRANACADVCCRMRMLAYADVCRRRSEQTRLHMLAYADVCVC